MEAVAVRVTKKFPVLPLNWIAPNALFVSPYRLSEGKGYATLSVTTVCAPVAVSVRSTLKPSAWAIVLKTNRTRSRVPRLITKVLIINVAFRFCD